MAAIGGVVLLMTYFAFQLRGRPAWLVGESPRSFLRVLAGGVAIGLLIGVPACTTSLFVVRAERSEKDELLTQAEQAMAADKPSSVEDLWPLLAFAANEEDEDHRRWLIIAAFRKKYVYYERGREAERRGQWPDAARAYFVTDGYRDAAIREDYARGRWRQALYPMDAAAYFADAGTYRDANAREKKARAAEAAAIEVLIERSRSREALKRLAAAADAGGIPGASELRRDAKNRVAAARRDIAAAQARLDAGDYSGALSILDTSDFVGEFRGRAAEIRKAARSFLDVVPSGGGSDLPDVDIPNIDIPGIPFM